MTKILIITTFFISTLSFSQNKDQINIFYKKAIHNHIKNLSSSISNGSSEIELKNIYFIAENIPIEYLPEKVDNYTIKYIDVYRKRNKKKIKKGITAVSIQPLKLNGNKVVVTLINFKITYKRRKYNFGNGGGSKTYFEYICSKEKWKFLKTNFTGI